MVAMESESGGRASTKGSRWRSSVQVEVTVVTTVLSAFSSPSGFEGDSLHDVFLCLRPKRPP